MLNTQCCWMCSFSFAHKIHSFLWRLWIYIHTHVSICCQCYCWGMVIHEYAWKTSFFFNFSVIAYSLFKHTYQTLSHLSSMKVVLTVDCPMFNYCEQIGLFEVVHCTYATDVWRCKQYYIRSGLYGWVRGLH